MRNYDQLVNSFLQEFQKLLYSASEYSYHKTCYRAGKEYFGRENVCLNEQEIECFIEKYPARKKSTFRRYFHHMFRRTRATNLYQDGVELELVSRYLGHASTVTTRIYAQPSIEMLRNLMEKSNPLSDIHVEKMDLLERLTEEDVIKMCGLRP